MALETLLLQKHDGVATLTLNRPERYNAFNLTMARELRDTWEALKADSEVVCIVVTGAGEKAFCTGMDVADVASGEATGCPWIRFDASCGRRRSRCRSGRGWGPGSLRTAPPDPRRGRRPSPRSFAGSARRPW